MILKTQFCGTLLHYDYDRKPFKNMASVLLNYSEKVEPRQLGWALGHLALRVRALGRRAALGLRAQDLGFRNPAHPAPL